MSIDELKTLLTDFDPASLLPDLGTMLGKVELAMRIAVLVGPVILLVMGLLYLFVSPKEANYHFGYRCFFGMGSVNAWRFSQRIAGLLWGLLGLVLTIVMLVTSKNFAGMGVVDMVWKAISCVLWEAGLTAGSCLLINTLVALRYDAKGENRSKKAEKKKE